MVKPGFEGALSTSVTHRQPLPHVFLTLAEAGTLFFLSVLESSGLFLDVSSFSAALGVVLGGCS